jgi:hypothetical protein
MPSNGYKRNMANNETTKMAGKNRNLRNVYLYQ